MGNINIEELFTPEAFVMKRITTSIGLNIRTEKASLDNQGNWIVPLKAIVPSQVTNTNNTVRTFLYKFENVGKVKLKKVDNEFKIIDFPRVNDIDFALHNKWYDLTQKVEQEILRVGESIWGELTYVRMLLRPMYTIIGDIITHHKLHFVDVKKNPQQLKHVNFLTDRKYLDFNTTKGQFEASNFLVKLSEELYKKYNDDAMDFFVTSKIVGGIFSKYYREIKSQLGAHAPSVYVDTSMAYYLDAIRSGEIIQMSLDELWRKYRMVGHRQTTAEIGSNYSTVVSEIVLGRLLAKNQEGYIYANDSVFNQLKPYGSELAKQLVEIP